MRALDLAVQRRQPGVAQRNPLARILQRRPEGALHAGLLRGTGHRGGLRTFAVGVENLPEVGDAERTVRTGERRGERRRLVAIGRDHFDAEPGKRLRLFGLRIADCA